MNIKLYKFEDNSFKLQAIIDDVQQASFEHKYFSAGQFTITINYNIPNAKLFQRGLFVQFGDNPYDFGEITTITNSIGENGKGSELVNIIGYDARYIFKRRIISNLNSNEYYNITADGETCIRSLITSQCGSGAEEKRRLPVNMGTAGTLGEEYTVNESYSNLYDVLVTIATQSKIGWRLKFNGGTLTLEVYEGTDRHNSVFFSEDMDSIKTGTYQDSSNNYTNAVLVAGKGTGTDRDIYEGEEAVNGSSPSGLDRYEAFDNQAELTTETEYENEADSILRQYGQTLTVNGAGLVKSPYVFREQYDIGDYITIRFSDKSAVTQITSITEQWSWNNYSLAFTFGKPVNGLDRQLQLLMRKVQQASNANSENSYSSVKWYDVSSVTSQEESDVTFNTLGFTGSSSWVSRSSGVTTDLYGIAFNKSLGLYCAVGYSGTILTSNDGITWTQRTSGVSLNFRGITYSEVLGIFVAVGQSGLIMTSSDGITWTQRTSGVTVYLYNVVEILGVLYTVGNNGTILTSSDGAIWTAQTSGVSTVWLRNIAYSKSLGVYVIVGNSGTILTSYDGINWTQILNGVTINYNIVNITYSEVLGIFVAVGQSGLIMTSSDGITWTQRTSGVSAYLWNIIYSYEFELFIIAADNGSILTSIDGINWTVTASGITQYFRNIIYVDKFIIVGDSGTILTLDVPLFTLYLDDENVGSKQYLLYVKNLTYGVKLTTALDTTKNTIIKAGTGIYTAWVAPDGDILLK